MTRRDDGPGGDARQVPPTRGRSRARRYALLVTGGLVLLVAAGVGVAVLARPAGPAAVPRDEFRAAVEGNTSHEVRKRYGWADQLVDHGDGTQEWYYHRRTYDPATGRVDPMARVDVGRGGRVVAVSFP